MNSSFVHGVGNTPLKFQTIGNALDEAAAWIQLRPGASATEEEMRDFCRGQIAHQKVPRYVRFVAEFPMTVTGKAQKFVMRRRMMEELGLRQEATA
jgi:fatty-acyl-CoA synthase